MGYKLGEIMDYKFSIKLDGKLSLSTDDITKALSIINELVKNQYYNFDFNTARVCSIAKDDSKDSIDR